MLFENELLLSTFQDNLVDFDSLIESLHEYPEIDKKSQAGGKDDSNNNDIEDYDSALRHLIDDLRVMKKNAQHQDSFDGLRVMRRNVQEPYDDLRVMRRNAQENLDGLRVMKKSAQEPAKGNSRLNTAFPTFPLSSSRFILHETE